MYSISVDEKYKFEINSEDLNWDAVEAEPGRFNILFNNRSYAAVVLSADYEQKSFTVRVDTHVFNLTAKDRFDILAEQLGFSSKATKKVNEIKAPMPGMVIAVLVNEGHEVTAGESILILEAMKMENVIKSPVDAVIKSIKVKQGSAVEKGQVLIEFA
jgi:biotin carboxyl carrier protein